MRALLLAALLTVHAAESIHGQAVPLAIGGRVEGALSARDPLMSDIGHFKVYRFEARAGQRLRFLVEGLGVEPRVKVAREVGGLTDYLTEAGDGDTERVLLRFTAPANGSYLLAIFSGDEDETGGFMLSSADITDAPAPAPRPLQHGQRIDGELNENSAYDEEHEQTFDYYSFRARAGELVMITMKSDDFDAYLEVGTLEGKSFDALEANDDAMGGTDARVRFEAPRDGLYIVRAAALSGIGAYSLQVAAPGAPAAPQRLTLEGEVTGELGERAAYDEDNDRTYDSWVLRAERGQKLTIRMRSDDFDTWLAVGTMTDGRFIELQSNDDVGSGTNSRIDMTVPSTGELLIRAAGLGDVSGDYVLVAGAAREFNLITPIRRDSMITGEIDDDAEYDEDESLSFRFYTFRAQAGESLEIVMISDDIDAHLALGVLSGSSFEEIDSDDDGFGDTNSRIRFTAERTGEYAIRAGSLGGAYGAFRLHVGRPGAIRRR